MDEPAHSGLAGEEIERRLACALEPRAEILEAYLHGSRAKGRAQAHSDIDVAVYIDESLASAGGYGYAAELTAHLMSALGTNRVDVAVLNRAPPVLHHRVLRDGRRVLARDLRATPTREGYALSRYCDFVPQLAKMRAARRRLSRRPGARLPPDRSRHSRARAAREARRAGRVRRPIERYLERSDAS